MPATCEHCGKYFSRRANYRRHLKLMHGEENEKDKSEEEESNESEEESQHEGSNEEKEDEEPYVENEDVDEVNDYWREIVSNAAYELEYDSHEDLLSEPFLSQVVDKMRKIVEDRLAFSNFMLSNSEIYHKIQRRKTHLEDDGPSEDDEALTETAWNDNRFRLKKVIEEIIESSSGMEPKDEREKEEDEVNEALNKLAEEQKQQMN